MQPRLNFYTASPDALKALITLERAVSQLPLEQSLVKLIKLRASQINNCAFCVDMHSRDALKHGEVERRLLALSVWRESPLFTPREYAALAWTEALTRLSETHAPDADYALLAGQFSPRECVDLTLAITTINSWNCLVVGFRKLPET